MIAQDQFIVLATPDGVWADPVDGEPYRLEVPVPVRWVQGNLGLVLLGEDWAALFKGGQLELWNGLKSPWAPLGHPMDGERSLLIPDKISLVKDRHEIYGLPYTPTKTWWVSGTFGLKGYGKVVGGHAGRTSWVFNQKNNFVYWSGIHGKLVYGDPPEEPAVVYDSHLPFVAAKNRYYFSQDGHQWYMRRVDGWPIMFRAALLIYREGSLYMLQGYL